MKTNNIQKIDFSKLYEEQYLLSTHAKQNNCDDWDKKAPMFNDEKRHEKYIENFLNYVRFDDCFSLFSFACGSGILEKHAILKSPNLTKNGIFLMDFSKKMLEFAKQNCQMAKTFLGSFEDILKAPKCDLVFASRCLMTNDLQKSLKMLLQKTKKRFYFTIKKDGFFINPTIISHLKLNIHPNPDYIYAANILYKMGLDFSLKKIDAANPTFDNFDDLLNAVCFSLRNNLNTKQINALKDLYNQNPNITSANYSWVIFEVNI